MSMGKIVPVGKLIILSICSLLFLTAAQAENNQPYTLASLIKEAIASNPEVLSAKNAFESAGARRNGWLLAPLVAEVVTAYALDAEPGPWAARMAPSRFT